MLCYVMLHYITLHYITLHYITLYYIINFYTSILITSNFHLADTYNCIYFINSAAHHLEVLNDSVTPSLKSRCPLYFTNREMMMPLPRIHCRIARNRIRRRITPLAFPLLAVN